MTKSDHEIIAFNLLSKNAQKIDSSLNASYNVQKANWINFIKNLQSNYVSAKAKMQSLIQISNIENMKKIIILLRLTIEDAIVENISKKRSCNQLKVWWLQTLTDKRKFMTYSKRQWKIFKIQSDWELFKKSRNDYFYAFKEVKNKSWTNFLNNAKRKKSVSSIQVHKISKCWKIIIYFTWWNKNSFRRKMRCINRSNFFTLIRRHSKKTPERSTWRDKSFWK